MRHLLQVTVFWRVQYSFPRSKVIAECYIKAKWKQNMVFKCIKTMLFSHECGGARKWIGWNKYSIDSLFVGSKSFLKSAFKYYDNGGADAPALIRISIQISIADHMKTTDKIILYIVLAQLNYDHGRNS